MTLVGLSFLTDTNPHLGRPHCAPSSSLAASIHHRGKSRNVYSRVRPVYKGTLANPIHLCFGNCNRYAANMSFIADHVRSAWNDKQTHVVMFSATAIALYGYDQGNYGMLSELVLKLTVTKG